MSREIYSFTYELCKAIAENDETRFFEIVTKVTDFSLPLEFGDSAPGHEEHTPMVTPLKVAVNHRRRMFLKEMMQRGADPVKVTNYVQSAAEKAMDLGDIFSLALMNIFKTMQPYAIDRRIPASFYSPFIISIFAARQDQWLTFQQFIDRIVNEPGHAMETKLADIVLGRKVSIAGLGSKSSYTDPFGNNFLHYLILAREYDQLKQVLTKKIDSDLINKSGIFGLTPLHTLIFCRSNDPHHVRDLIKLLEDHGALTDLKDERGISVDSFNLKNEVGAAEAQKKKDQEENPPDLTKFDNVVAVDFSKKGAKKP